MSEGSAKKSERLRAERWEADVETAGEQEPRFGRVKFEMPGGHSGIDVGQALRDRVWSWAD